MPPPMNLLASYNWIREYLKTDLTVEEFARRTTAAGNGVERMEDVAARFDHIVVGVIDSVEKHPNADKLRVCRVDIGTAAVQIVCGGTNLKKNQRVAVALPGSSVRWHGEGEPVVLQETEIRGQKSHGMICAPEELGFDLALEGERPIWDLTKLTRAEAGTPLADALGLNDVILDIEVTGNRPDGMSIVGQAREGFAAVGGKFTWKPKRLPAVPADVPTLPVTVDAPELAPKYEAVVLDHVKVGPSPWWLQRALLLAGHAPINNVVDVTNYVLLELGHPLHAFDAGALAGAGIFVRRARAGESIEALDGKTHALTPDMLVIADRDKPAAIAGVIGGRASGTTAATTRVVLESAVFDPVSIRRTARALNLQTDASSLFEKGLSAQAAGPALARAVELLRTVAGARVASQVSSIETKPYQTPAFPFDPQKASALIGVEIPAKEQVALLKRLGFALAPATPSDSPLEKGRGRVYRCTVPYWRDHDIEGPRDFVEEIARLYGYAHIPSTLPCSTAAAAPADPLIGWERRTKEILAGAGLTESYNSSFVSARQLERYGLSTDLAVKIDNPLSADQEFMRPSLVPSLLTVVEANQRRQPRLDLFELAPAYEPSKDELPAQTLRLAMAFAGVDGDVGFRRAKGALERLAAALGIRTLRMERLASGTDDPRWHRMRSAAVWIGEHEHVGMIGQVSRATAAAFGLEQPAFLVDASFDRLVRHASSSTAYRPIPAFPESKRDLAFVVDRKIEYARVEQALREASPLLHEVALFDVYEGEGVPAGQKSLALHLVFRAADRTLSSDDVETEMRKLRDVLASRFHAMMRT